MKTIETTVYTYEELLELHKQGKVKGAAVEKAKEWLREGQVDHEWWDYIYEMWKKALHQIGFEDAEISFSGFWSQGDGASFVTKNVNCDKLIRFLSAKPVWPESIGHFPNRPEGWTACEYEDYRGFIVKECNGVRTEPAFRKLLRHSDYLSADVTRFGREVHWNSCTFKVEWRGPERHNDLVNDFETTGEELRKDLSRAIYKNLEEEYNYQTSDEVIAEMAEANEYTFTIEGERR